MNHNAREQMAHTWSLAKYMQERSAEQNKLHVLQRNTGYWLQGQDTLKTAQKPGLQLTCAALVVMLSCCYDADLNSS